MVLIVVSVVTIVVSVVMIEVSGSLLWSIRSRLWSVVKICGFQSHNRGLSGHNHCLCGHYCGLCGNFFGLCGQIFFQTKFWIQYLNSSWNLLSNDMLQCIFCQLYSIFTVWKEILFASDRTRVIPNCAPPKKLPPLGIFAWLIFFNRCAAPASVRANRFGCGFLLWLTFFTAHIPICEAHWSRHKRIGYTRTKLENIWSFTEIASKRLSSFFLLSMSQLRLPKGSFTFST